MNVSDYAVPTSMLAEVLEPLLERLAAEYPAETTAGQYNSRGLCTLAERAAPRLGVKPEAVYRRLYSIRNGKSKRTNANIADALLICLGVNIGDTDIPTLPTNKHSAREMVETYHELKGIELSSFELRSLSWRLLRVSRTFLDTLDPTVLDDAPIPLIEVAA